jgi:hypothetical protein
LILTTTTSELAKMCNYVLQFFFFVAIYFVASDQDVEPTKPPKFATMRYDHGTSLATKMLEVCLCTHIIANDNDNHNRLLNA